MLGSVTPSPTASRHLVAVGAIVLVLAGPYYVDALEIGGGDLRAPDALAIAGTGFVLFVSGYLIRHWWALLTPLAAILLTLPLGANPEDSDRWLYAALLLFSPLLILGVAALGAGILAGRINQRESMS